MSFIRSLVSKHRAYVVAIIFLFGEIISIYSYYVLKGLVYVIIIASLGCQPSFYIKYIKLNIRLFYNIKLVSNAKYIYFMRFCIL